MIHQKEKEVEEEEGKGLHTRKAKHKSRVDLIALYRTHSAYFCFGMLDKKDPQ